MEAIFDVLGDPQRFIALGNLLGAFTDIIRGDVAAIFTEQTSAALSDGNGWSALSDVSGAVLGS